MVKVFCKLGDKKLCTSLHMFIQKFVYMCRLPKHNLSTRKGTQVVNTNSWYTKTCQLRMAVGYENKTWLLQQDKPTMSLVFIKVSHVERQLGLVRLGLHGPLKGALTCFSSLNNVLPPSFFYSCPLQHPVHLKSDRSTPQLRQTPLLQRLQRVGQEKVGQKRGKSGE